MTYGRFTFGLALFFLFVKPVVALVVFVLNTTFGGPVQVCSTGYLMHTHSIFDSFPHYANDLRPMHTNTNGAKLRWGSFE